MVLNIKFLLTSLIVLSLMVVIQCGSPTKPQSRPDPIESIRGLWYWKTSIGGIAGHTRTPLTEGYLEHLSIRSDSTFNRYRWDSTGRFYDYSGKYYIAYEEITFWSHIDSAYVLHLDNAEPAIIESDSTSLTLIEMCADCFTFEFGMVTGI